MNETNPKLNAVLQELERRQAEETALEARILKAFHQLFDVLPGSPSYLRRSVLSNGVGLAMGRKKIPGTMLGAAIKRAVTGAGVEASFSTGRPIYKGVALKPAYQHLQKPLERTRLSRTALPYRDKLKAILDGM